MRFVWENISPDQSRNPLLKQLMEKPLQQTQSPEKSSQAETAESPETAKKSLDFLHAAPELKEFSLALNHIENNPSAQLNSLRLLTKTALQLKNASAEEKWSLVHQLRNGTTSIAPEKRLSRYAAMTFHFLKREPGENDVYRFQPGSPENDQYLGMAHILPAEVRAVQIKHSGNQPWSEVAYRTITQDRFGNPIVGYCINGQYVAIHEGDLIKPVKVAAIDNPEVQKTIADEQKLLEEQMKNPLPKLDAGSSKSNVENVNNVPKAAESRTMEAVAGYTARLDQSEKMDDDIPQKIVASARKYKDIYIPELLTEDVAGGRYACAKFATMVLKEAGIIAEMNLNAKKTGELLQNKYGWREISAPPKAGAVLIFPPYPGGKHGHIAIATGPHTMMHKSSNHSEPVEQSIPTDRPFQILLHPPTKESDMSHVDQRVNHLAQTKKRQEKPLTNAEARQNLIESNPGFLERVEEIADKIGCSKEALLKIFEKECGYNPHAINKQSGASGLIQFMPFTAIRLGTSIQAIRTMSAMEQLDYVEKFFRPYFGKIHSYAELYMAVFYPIALGKSDDFVLGSESGPNRVRIVHQQNRGMDREGKGYITKADFLRYAGKEPMPLDLPPARSNASPNDTIG